MRTAISPRFAAKILDGIFDVADMARTLWATRMSGRAERRDNMSRGTSAIL